MGVEIKVLGHHIESGIGSEECAAAKQLEQIFIKEFENKNDISGAILIKPNFKALHQQPEDIDIVVWMNLENYNYSVFTGHSSKINNRYEITHEKIKEDVNFSSLLLTIELKSHTNSGVEITNNNLIVFTGNDKKSATEQSNGQKYSLVNYIKRIDQQLAKVNPRVNNLVWLPNMNGAKPWSCQLNNIILGGLDFKKLIEIAFEHVPPVKNYKKVYQNSFKDNNLVGDANNLIENIFLNYDKKIILKQGDLSRRKLEQVVQKQLEGENKKIFEHIGNKTTIIKGVPGSGKTINLLHFAYHLAANKGERCLILTYNKALIADINRLAVLAGFKDDPSSATVGTNTCMRLMRTLLIAWGIYEEEPTKLSPPERNNYFKVNFFDKYEALLSELLNYLNIADENEIEEEKQIELALSWKTILIDESQDWYKGEKDVLYKLFGAENCVIAYGSHQLIRNTEGLNWYDGAIDLQLLNLKTSYRQKSNLCHYIKNISSRLELKDDIVINNQLNGGDIHIYNKNMSINDYNYHFDYCVNICKNAGYDILLLVNHNDNYINILKEGGILLHDGTKESNKMKKPEDMDACRVFNYQSCRGLEGWIVIANNLDSYLEQVAINTTEPEPGLSLAETKRKAVAQWLYMILSRPIDRLVITLNNSTTEYSQLILKAANDHQDYCTYHQ